MHGLIRQNHRQISQPQPLFPLDCNRQAEKIQFYPRLKNSFAFAGHPRLRSKTAAKISRAPFLHPRTRYFPPRAPSFEQPSPRQTRIIRRAPKSRFHRTPHPPPAPPTGIRHPPPAPASNRNPNEAQLFAFDSCSSSIKIVGVSSTARRNRNQESSGTCRTSRGAISLKSTAINPKPPPCNSKSVARSVCSTFRQRTHNNFRNSTPAASAECGSNASPPSISAQASSCAVRALNAASSKLVRPEHEGPKISVSAPRGNPPVNKSISGMPLETVTTSWRPR